MAIILGLLCLASLFKEHRYVRHENYELAKAFNIITLVFAVFAIASPFISLVFVRPRLNLSYYKILSICDFVSVIIGWICGQISYWSVNDSDVSVTGRFALCYGFLVAIPFFILMNGWWYSNWIG